MCETPVLVLPRATGVIGVVYSPAENYARMTEMVIMDVYPGSLFYITILNFDKVAEHLPEP